MRGKSRLKLPFLVPVAAAVLGFAGLVAAPTAVAGCNDSSGTTVCAQGAIRGTHGAAPTAPTNGAYGTWCSSGACYGGFGYGFAIGR